MDKTKIIPIFRMFVMTKEQREREERRRLRLYEEQLELVMKARVVLSERKLLEHQVGMDRSEDLAVLEQGVRTTRRQMEHNISILELWREDMVRRGVSLVEEADEGEETEFFPKVQGIRPRGMGSDYDPPEF